MRFASPDRGVGCVGGDASIQFAPSKIQVSPTRWLTPLITTCPPKRTNWSCAASYAVDAPLRGGGVTAVRSANGICVQLVIARVADVLIVVFWRLVSDEVWKSGVTSLFALLLGLGFKTGTIGLRSGAAPLTFVRPQLSQGAA